MICICVYIYIHMQTKDILSSFQLMKDKHYSSKFLFLEWKTSCCNNLQSLPHGVSLYFNSHIALLIEFQCYSAVAYYVATYSYLIVQLQVWLIERDLKKEWTYFGSRVKGEIDRISKNSAGIIRMTVPEKYPEERVTSFGAFL